MNNPTGLITTLFSKIKKGEGVPIILVDQVIVICVFSLQKRVKKKSCQSEKYIQISFGLNRLESQNISHYPGT